MKDAFQCQLVNISYDEIAIIGPVLDIQFTDGHLPPIYIAINRLLVLLRHLSALANPL